MKQLYCGIDTHKLSLLLSNIASTFCLTYIGAEGFRLLLNNFQHFCYSSYSSSRYWFRLSLPFVGIQVPFLLGEHEKWFCLKFRCIGDMFNSSGSVQHGFDWNKLYLYKLGKYRNGHEE